MQRHDSDDDLAWFVYQAVTAVVAFVGIFAIIFIVAVL